MRAEKGGYAEINERAPAGRHNQKTSAFNMFPYFMLSLPPKCHPELRGRALVRPQPGEGSTPLLCRVSQHKITRAATRRSRAWVKSARSHARVAQPPPAVLARSPRARWKNGPLGP